MSCTTEMIRHSPYVARQMINVAPDLDITAF